jgi:catechol 2,3-dioxygenase-like lactoylglutathione lyase family enzyme
VCLYASLGEPLHGKPWNLLTGIIVPVMLGKQSIHLIDKRWHMLTEIHPKLPMRNPQATIAYYVDKLGFTLSADYGDYLLMKKDAIEIHFFAFKALNPLENYGQVYIRTFDIDALYKFYLEKGVEIHPNAPLQKKPWGQREFSLLDPDNNLLTFGQTDENE